MFERLGSTFSSAMATSRVATSGVATPTWDDAPSISTISSIHEIRPYDNMSKKVRKNINKNVDLFLNKRSF